MSIESGKRLFFSRRAIVIGLASAPVCLTAANETYEQSILRYRKEAEDHFRSASGPLTLVARFSPHEGTSTFGGAASTLVVPDKAAPARIGEVTVKGGKATLRFAPSVQAAVDGKNVSFIEAENQSDKGASAMIGALRVRLYFIRGEQLQIS